jgi:hypothetical protein
MSPNELARRLNRIASAIENSKSPSRELVAQDLRKILSFIDPMTTMTGEEEMHDMENSHVGEAMHEAGLKENIIALAIGAATILGVRHCDQERIKDNLPKITSKLKTAPSPMKAARNVVQAIGFGGEEEKFDKCAEGKEDSAEEAAACLLAVCEKERWILEVDENGQLTTGSGAHPDMKHPYMTPSW